MSVITSVKLTKTFAMNFSSLLKLYQPGVVANSLVVNARLVPENSNIEKVYQ